MSRNLKLIQQEWGGIITDIINDYNLFSEIAGIVGMNSPFVPRYISDSHPDLSRGVIQ